MSQRLVMHAAIFASTMVNMIALAQDEAQKGEGLNRETVEHLLKVVSPTCKDEMQEALSEQKELTVECKEEIQSALRERDSGSRVPLPGANADAMPIESRDNTAVYLVLFFVVLLVAGLFALCTFINQEKSKMPPVVDKSKGKGKKWKKKQAEKKARKEQNKRR